MLTTQDKRLLVGGVFLLVLGGVAAQIEEACSNGETIAPHHNCSLYYVCTPAPVEQTCPAGLVFNPRISACDFPMNVPECVGGTRPPGGTTTALPPTSTSTITSTSTSSTTRPTTTRPTIPTETPETEGTPPAPTTTGLPSLQCDATGIHKVRHPDRCDSYFWCINGALLPEVHVCPDGLLFDPQLRECNFEAVVQCDVDVTNGPTGTLPTTTPPSTEFPDCAPGESTVHPYPGNCTLYIICVDGSMTFYKCPEGMLFDSVTRQCRPEEVAVCASSTAEKLKEVDTLKKVDVEDVGQIFDKASNNFPSLQMMWRSVFARWT